MTKPTNIYTSSTLPDLSIHDPINAKLIGLNFEGFLFSILLEIHKMMHISSEIMNHLNAMYISTLTKPYNMSSFQCMNF